MNKPLNLETAILDFVHSGGYKPSKLRGIAKQLKLQDDEKSLKRTVKRLIKQGRLAHGPKHLIIAPPEKSQPNSSHSDKPRDSQQTSEPSNEVTGTFRKAAAGYGFVTPKDSTATDRSEDIFIPKQKTLDAADLDVVRIRLSRGREDSRGISGRVVKVLERHTNQFVGTYGEQDEKGFVIVDGGVFESGIMVGDAGAKNCKAGDKVVIEMVSFPSNREEGEGVIVEVLGDRGAPGVDTLSIIRQFDLPEEFPESVLESAREQAEAFQDETIPEGRTDFTNETIITIDPKTARDFDDAISLKKLENGHWQLGVYIADVSHFVPQKSELDKEASNEGPVSICPTKSSRCCPRSFPTTLPAYNPTGSGIA